MSKMLLTYAEVADILSVHRNTVVNLVRRGELVKVELSKSPNGARITRESAEGYVKRLIDAAMDKDGAA